MKKFWAWLKKLLGIGGSDPKPPEPVDPPAPPAPTLPTNPAIAPDPAEGRGERWDLARKDYDQTWRVRWPSTLAREHGVGPGSWCEVNGARAQFRSFDTDSGAKRPSYTMPLATPITFPATAILYKPDGTALAYFIAPGPNTNGRLP